MEIYSSTTRFALACNLSSKIIEPIQSRCAIVRFNRLTDVEVLDRLMLVAQAEKVRLHPVCPDLTPPLPCPSFCPLSPRASTSRQGRPEHEKIEAHSKTAIPPLPAPGLPPRSRTFRKAWRPLCSQRTATCGKP